MWELVACQNTNLQWQSLHVVLDTNLWEWEEVKQPDPKLKGCNKFAVCQGITALHCIFFAEAVAIRNVKCVLI